RSQAAMAKSSGGDGGFGEGFGGGQGMYPGGGERPSMMSGGYPGGPGGGGFGPGGPTRMMRPDAGRGGDMFNGKSKGDRGPRSFGDFKGGPGSKGDRGDSRKKRDDN